MEKLEHCRADCRSMPYSLRKVAAARIRSCSCLERSRRPVQALLVDGKRWRRLEEVEGVEEVEEVDGVGELPMRRE